MKLLTFAVAVDECDRTAVHVSSRVVINVYKLYFIFTKRHSFIHSFIHSF